jgi:hypothetical protein
MLTVKVEQDDCPMAKVELEPYDKYETTGLALLALGDGRTGGCCFRARALERGPHLMHGLAGVVVDLPLDEIRDRAGAEVALGRTLAPRQRRVDSRKVSCCDRLFLL